MDPQAARYPGWSPYCYALADPMRLVDPTGAWVETALDATSLALSIRDFKNDPTLLNALLVAADAIPLALPAVPAVVGYVRHGDDLFDVAKLGSAAGDAARGADAAGAAGRAGEAASTILEGGTSFKSFDALKTAMGPAGEGKQWHHIVEQSQEARFGTEAIQNSKNVVAVPAEVNQRLNGLYSSIRSGITGSETMTVREWLSSKSYDEAYEFGQTALRNIQEGVW